MDRKSVHADLSLSVVLDHKGVAVPIIHARLRLASQLLQLLLASEQVYAFHGRFGSVEYGRRNMLVTSIAPLRQPTRKWRLIGEPNPVCSNHKPALFYCLVSICARSELPRYTGRIVTPRT